MVIANSLDPDQTLHSMAPDLDLRPLHMTFLCETRQLLSSVSQWLYQVTVIGKEA